MRLKSVAPFLLLQNTLGPFQSKTHPLTLSAGTVVLLLTYGLERGSASLNSLDRMASREWDVFMSNRWNDEVVGPKLSECFYAFGGGARICPGRFLAMAELELVTLSLFGFFDFHLVHPAKVKSIQQFTYQAQDLAVVVKPCALYAHSS